MRLTTYNLLLTTYCFLLLTTYYLLTAYRSARRRKTWEAQERQALCGSFFCRITASVAPRGFMDSGYHSRPAPAPGDRSQRRQGASKAHCSPGFPPPRPGLLGPWASPTRPCEAIFVSAVMGTAMLHHERTPCPVGLHGLVHGGQGQTPPGWRIEGNAPRGATMY